MDKVEVEECYDAQRTALLIHNLIDNQQSSEVTDQLEPFSQLLTRRNIHFTACGFFYLDLKLVTSIACTVTPVALFLVQYNNRQFKPLPP